MFLQLLKEQKAQENELLTKNESADSSAPEPISEAPKKPEEVLRGAGFKIKLVTPTSFGTQIDFAKRYEQKDIEKALTNFKIKIKDRSVFVVN